MGATKYHKFNCLKHTFILYSFCVGRDLGMVSLCVGSYKAINKISAGLCSHPET